MLEYTGNEKVGSPLHIHFHEDEIFYITEGEYRFMVGNTEMIAREGDAVFLPRNIPNAWIQLSGKGRQLYMLQPSGTFEGFLQELQNSTTPLTEEEIQAIHLKHGMKVLALPLTMKQTDKKKI